MHLRVYLIWQPALLSDDRTAAERRTREFTNERLTHFWDGSRFTGRLWQRILNHRDMSWDVYFLYGADAQWEKGPTPPYFWLSPLNSVTKGRFQLKTKELLSQIQ